MNITHAVKEEVVGDRLEAIFNRQKELMEKYHYIEERSGLLQTSDCPVNLDDKRGQARLKDFSWRVTEELGEALDAINDVEHFEEELVDGLHFLTEMTILAGQTPKDIVSNSLEAFNINKNEDLYERITSSGDCLCSLYVIAVEVYDCLDFDARVSKFIENLGMTCNCLKNKPWKQSNMITDRAMYFKRLSMAWVSYLSVMEFTMGIDNITDTYLKKSQVNKFRQRSNY